ncbi:ABC transporter ATP-binding protein [Kitasatospora cheerisanensis]|uniref:ABC transporter ATP-binding protein n=1 Tax=Kitasatospora cheerisanensis TaxID=81942 RepID=UPI00055E609E|nr:ATP-binding cassette domain-containing protein [Kitasatospora cheerisanensis]
MSVPHATRNPDQRAAIDVSGLHYSLGDRHLLQDLDLRVDAGESVAVVGPSGSGKSTLLSCLLGLLRPSSGTVVVDGVDLRTLRGRAMARHRQRSIGMVFQFGELLPELTPRDNVALAALLGRQERSTAYQRASALLDELGVPQDVRTDRLSGGERQRTAVARALINTPRLLLADEPTGALDEDTRDHVADILFALPEQHRCGLLVVTHDHDIAARADRVLRLVGGSLHPAAAVVRD